MAIYAPSKAYDAVEKKTMSMHDYVIPAPRSVIALVKPVSSVNILELNTAIALCVEFCDIDSTIIDIKKQVCTIACKYPKLRDFLNDVLEKDKDDLKYIVLQILVRLGISQETSESFFGNTLSAIIDYSCSKKINVNVIYDDVVDDIKCMYSRRETRATRSYVYYLMRNMQSFIDKEYTSQYVRLSAQKKQELQDDFRQILIRGMIDVLNIQSIVKQYKDNTFCTIENDKYTMNNTKQCMRECIAFSELFLFHDLQVSDIKIPIDKMSAVFASKIYNNLMHDVALLKSIMRSTKSEIINTNKRLKTYLIKQYKSDASAQTDDLFDIIEKYPDRISDYFNLLISDLTESIKDNPAAVLNKIHIKNTLLTSVINHDNKHQNSAISSDILNIIFIDLFTVMNLMQKNEVECKARCSLQSSAGKYLKQAFEIYKTHNNFSDAIFRFSAEETLSKIHVWYEESDGKESCQNAITIDPAIIAYKAKNTDAYASTEESKNTDTDRATIAEENTVEKMIATPDTISVTAPSIVDLDVTEANMEISTNTIPASLHVKIPVYIKSIDEEEEITLHMNSIVRDKNICVEHKKNLEDAQIRASNHAQLSRTVMRFRHDMYNVYEYIPVAASAHVAVMRFRHDPYKKGKPCVIMYDHMHLSASNISNTSTASTNSHEKTPINEQIEIHNETIVQNIIESAIVDKTSDMNTKATLQNIENQDAWREICTRDFVLQWYISAEFNLQSKRLYGFKLELSKDTFETLTLLWTILFKPLSLEEVNRLDCFRDTKIFDLIIDPIVFLKNTYQSIKNMDIKTLYPISDMNTTAQVIEDKPTLTRIKRYIKAYFSFFAKEKLNVEEYKKLVIRCVIDLHNIFALFDMYGWFINRKMNTYIIKLFKICLLLFNLYLNKNKDVCFHPRDISKETYEMMLEQLKEYALLKPNQ